MYALVLETDGFQFLIDPRLLRRGRLERNVLVS